VSLPSLAASLAAVGILTALAANAAADPTIKVAVVPGIAVNLDAARVDVLGQDLADALRAELLVDSLGGLEVRRQLPAEGLPPDCVATPTCIADVAKRLGANQLLFVVMVDTGTGGAIQVDSTWVDVATGKSQSRPAVDVAAIAEATQRFAAAARQLLPDAPVRPKPKTGGSQIGHMSTEIPRHITTPQIITGAATVVGLGVGISFGLMARSKYNSCKSMVDNDYVSCSDSTKDGIRNKAIVADAGWLVAIGGAVTTVILYATSGESSHLIVEPSPSGATVGYFGRF
jgi:hypothetical protein